jgi:hypothetical protein
MDRFKKIFSKKNLIKNFVMLFFLLIILFAIIFLSNSHWNWNDILNYLPWGFDKIVIIKSPKQEEKNLIQSQIWKEFLDILDTTNKIIIAQKISQNNGQSLIIINWKNNFQPQNILTILNGQTWEVKYIYEKIKNNFYIFGDQKTIDIVQGLNQINSFWQNPKFKNYFKTLNNDTIVWISKIDSQYLAVPWQDQISNYLDNFDYFFAGIKIQWKSDVQIDSYLTYKISWIKGGQKVEYKFEDNIKWYYGNWDLLFIQIGNLTKLLWLGKDQIITLLKSFALTQNINDLTETDYQKLYEILDNNIWIFAWKANNIANLWLAVIFKNSDSFDVLSKVIVKFGDQIKNFSFISWSTLSSVLETNKVWFKTLIAWIQEVGMYFEKNWSDTLLTIWDPILGEKWKWENLYYSKNSILSFVLDFDALINLYSQVWNFWWMNNQNFDVQQLDFVKWKKLKGQINLWEKDVSLRAKIR